MPIQAYRKHKVQIYDFEIRIQLVLTIELVLNYN